MYRTEPSTHPFIAQVIGMPLVSTIEIDKLLEGIIRIVVLWMSVVL
jgi:hypothetical protein